MEHGRYQSGIRKNCQRVSHEQGDCVLSDVSERTQKSSSKTLYNTYRRTIAIALNGVGPFIWIPLANVYGRRPIYLATTLIGAVSALGSGFARNFSQLLGVRAVNGIFPVSMALGPATVTDLFFYHQRGRALGLFTVFLTSGSHFAALFGGPVGQFLGWRWIFWITSIMNFITLAVIIVGLPETGYFDPRASTNDGDALPSPTPPPFSKRLYYSQLKPYTKFPGFKLKLRHFVLPSFRMAIYPSVLLPALYYAAQYCFAAILPAVTYSVVLEERFGWSTLQAGLAYGGTFTIGSIAGEVSHEHRSFPLCFSHSYSNSFCLQLLAGMVLDSILARESKRLGTDTPPPEVRLKAIWSGAILIPVGLLIYGFCMQYPAPWAAVLLGMFISIFGIQIVATSCYTYAIDCYRVEGLEVAQLFNFIRQEFSFTLAFYAVPLAHKIGFQFEMILFAGLGSVIAFLPMLWLMKYGRSVRHRMGQPKNVCVMEEIVRNARGADEVDP